MKFRRSVIKATELMLAERIAWIPPAIGLNFEDIIFGQTENRRGRIGFLGGNRIFFLWGHKGGSQPEHGIHPSPF